MLLRFSVENHLSIRERQELSFAASSLKDNSEGLIACNTVHSSAVVPVVVIYGANASGKTNFINAVSNMRGLVLWSQIEGRPGGGVPRHEFLLDPGYSEKPSCFEIDFLLDGIRYHYGFEATDDAFTSEWLYQIPRSHRRMLYERNGQEFSFGRWLKGQNHTIANLTRMNSLFLSAAAQSGHELLSQIYKYFLGIAFSSRISVGSNHASLRIERDGLDDRLIKFLKAIGTGVVGYRKKVPESESYRAFKRGLIESFEQGYGSLSDNFKKSLVEEDRLSEFELAHLEKGGKNVYFGLEQESAGTRRLLIILNQSFKAIDNGSPLFVDEVDVSLHTYVSEAILRLFCSPRINRSGAQIVVTTHDTNLMSSEALRRDQLWFAEKNIEGATEIYPLTDIRTRKGDNLELGYLQGRYGAGPSDDPLASLLGSYSNAKAANWQDKEKTAE